MAHSVVRLKKGKEVSLLRRHPWVFSGAVKKIEGDPEEGDFVKVLDSKGAFLGAGHWQQGSIAVRILTFENRKPDSAFWYEKLKTAASLRRQLRFPSGENTAFRLVFGEGDSLPGLVIDWYDGNAVVQSHSIGMHKCRHQIAEALQKIFNASLKSVYYKSSETLPKFLEAENEFLWGDNRSTVIKEHGHQFKIDWIDGQKTGFFIDQRENRKLLASYSKGKKVLNTFCYSGGFSVYAMKSGATQVDSVDCSAKAIELTNSNMDLNAPDGYSGSTFK